MERSSLGGIEDVSFIGVRCTNHHCLASLMERIPSTKNTVLETLGMSQDQMSTLEVIYILVTPTALGTTATSALLVTP